MTETTTGTAVAPIVQLREELAPMKAEFGAVLPSHITPKKFAQVCITAIENNPDLLRADRQSFKVACLNAANDGLLPDKREGAFVIFNTEIEVRKEGRAAVEKVRVPTVVWMPMITGILKKAYQTGKVQSISVEIVYENDVYRRAAGDNAEIVHEPLDFGERGQVRGGYAIIRMTDGGDPYREVVSLADIEKVRNVSRSKDKGPWVTFWEEMAKKTILRRALKRVPLSADVDRVLARDDVFYNLDAERRPAIAMDGERAVPRDALFDGRVHHRRRRSRAEEPRADDTPPPIEAGADAGSPPEEDGAERDQRALIAALEEVDRAEAFTDLGVARQAAEAVCVDDDERVWVAERATKRFVELGGVIGDGRPETDGNFVYHTPRARLRAQISSASGLSEYEEPNFWRSDILAKLDAVSGDALRKFWHVNASYLREARDNGYGEDVDKILAVARGKGLPDV